ncbi:urease accessory protein UreD [Spirillospora sp. CA-255316]
MTPGRQARSYTARAAVTAERGPSGGTRLTRLRSDGPLALRETSGPGDPCRAVHLVGAAAGPLGGDDLELEVTVGPGARLAVRSVATSLALPGEGESRMGVRAEVGAGGHLDFAPEPTVAAAGCRHRALARIDLAEGATLRWYEELILGRHREPPGRHTSRFDVTAGGVPLLRHELRLDDPAVHGSRAVLAGARAVGSVLLAGPGLTGTPRTGEGWAVLPLAGPGVLVTAVAPDSAALRRRLRAGEDAAADADVSVSALRSGTS